MSPSSCSRSAATTPRDGTRLARIRLQIVQARRCRKARSSTTKIVVLLAAMLLVPVRRADFAAAVQPRPSPRFAAVSQQGRTGTAASGRPCCFKELCPRPWAGCYLGCSLLAVVRAFCGPELPWSWGLAGRVVGGMALWPGLAAFRADPRPGGLGARRIPRNRPVFWPPELMARCRTPRRDRPRPGPPHRRARCGWCRWRAEVARFRGALYWLPVKPVPSHRPANPRRLRQPHRRNAVISVVIPVYNEKKTVCRCCTPRSSPSPNANGSTSKSCVRGRRRQRRLPWKVIKDIAAKHSNVRGLALSPQCSARRRRHWRPASTRPAADYIVTLDADLQDDPAERFRASWRRCGAAAHRIRTRPAKTSNDDDFPGVYDVVSGWKKVRHDPWQQGRAGAASSTAW